MKLALKIWNSLMFLLSRIIYLLIKWLYQVFEAVSNANLFTEEIFDELTGRIYLIMGIAMLFIFAYNLVLMIINPDDKKGTGAMGKIVKETIISLIAVVLLPTIFSYMYTFQSHVISSNLIGQLILGGAGAGAQDKSQCSEGDYECTCDFSFLGSGGAAQEIKTECDKYYDSKTTTSKRGANLVPITLFSAFYRPANFTINECANHLAQGDNSVINESGDDHDICVSYFTGYQLSKYTGKISYLADQEELQDGLYEDPKLMEYDSILALLGGILGAWMFLCYAMEIGTRVIKLGVLQLISPIPVMMRIIPGQKEKIYDKWFKELLKTYLDVFIRLVIIYFALYAVSLVDDMIATLWSSITDSDSGGFVQVLAVVIVILGILKFAQEAPELIKTFFGNTGRFSIKPSDRKDLRGIAGALGAGTSSMIGNFAKGKGLGKLTSGIGGFVGGARRGFMNGYKSKDVKGLKKGIMQAKYDSDEAREKHVATRARGAINGKEIPVVSSLWGATKNKYDDLKAGGKEFTKFISGEGAADFRAQAVADALGRVTGIKDTFKNAAIEAIEAAQSKTNEEYNSSKKINVAGVEYERKVDGLWYGSDGSKEISHTDMGKIIKEAFTEMKKVAYAERYEGNPEAYAEMSNAMITSLTDNINKIGNDFSVKFFAKLKDSDGINMNINNMSEFSTEMEKLQKTGNYQKLFEINESIEDLLKAQKLQNAAAAEAKKDK